MVNIKLLKTIIQMSQQELKEYLKTVLCDMGYITVDRKGFLYAEGDIPVLLAAHLDTVHRDRAEIICFSEDGRYVMSPQGIGGDDRCGVYMILQIIRQSKCHVLFCEDEEVGGRGARIFAESGIIPDVNYIVEMDRRGNNDAVFYECDNPEFTDFVLGFGFEEKTGSFSDISVVAPRLKTAAVNISAGYYNEHRQHEYIDLIAVENNIRRITQLVMTKTKHFRYKKRKGYGDQISMFGWVPMDFSYSGRDNTKKLMMDIPDTARLVCNGVEIFPVSDYLMDKEGKVYIYLKELNAVVESEYTFTCDGNGEQVSFSCKNARQLAVLSLEEALEQLSIV